MRLHSNSIRRLNEAILYSRESFIPRNTVTKKSHVNKVSSSLHLHTTATLMHKDLLRALQFLMHKCRLQMKIVANFQIKDENCCKLPIKEKN